MLLLVIGIKLKEMLLNVAYGYRLSLLRAFIYFKFKLKDTVEFLPEVHAVFAGKKS